jgi:hypothetical protein
VSCCVYIWHNISLSAIPAGIDEELIPILSPFHHSFSKQHISVHTYSNSSTHTLWPWRWRQHVSPKHWKQCPQPCGVTMEEKN